MVLLLFVSVVNVIVIAVCVCRWLVAVVLCSFAFAAVGYVVGAC